MRTGPELTPRKWNLKSLSARQLSIGAVRAAPWVIFGPITGFMTEAAYRCFKKGRPVLGGLCVALNVSILVALPVLTAVIAAQH